jgi:type IV secretory pathway VirB10-like protein
LTALKNLVLPQIALRANRVDPAYSIYKLKINESVIGDHKKIGLSRQQYRDAVLRLEACGLATFRKTNQGTIAVLTNTAIFDINAESDERQIKACADLEKEPNYSHAKTIQQPLENQKETALEPSKEPSDLSMKNREKEPPKEPVNNHQRTIKEPDRNQSGTNPEPLTKKEEKKEEKRAAAAYSRTVYKCLDGLDLSDQEKRSLMYYSEHRVAHAVEFVKKKKNVDSPIGLLMWVCQQPTLPELPRESQKNRTPQQKLAWEYNQFLSSNGYAAQAKQNEEKIPNDRMVILEQGKLMPITLNHPLQILQEDFRKSKEEILKSQRIVRGLQGDKL